MKMSPTDTSVKPSGTRRGRGWVVFIAFLALAWSLPRPLFYDVVIEDSANSASPPRGRLAFRTAELLADFSGKGSLADDTELSGPCFASDGQNLFFSRSRPGQRADIVRSKFDGERWSRPESVRELNSVDDDRRLTLSQDGRTAALASNRSGGHGGFDLYESKHDGNRWSRPHNAGTTINTAADEFDPALSPDGRTLFFVRVVPEAGAELFVARRPSLDAEWFSPEPLAKINSPTTHERSPAVSPDGNWFLFSSNRGDSHGESASFALFRAPLREGHVDSAERLLDGIAADADDLDATFSPDGRSLVFASKREGPKQLFLSRGDVVVTRLTLSAAHLDQFGKAKWGVPFVGMLLLVAAWRWSRRVQPVQVQAAAQTPPTAAVIAPRRSEPPKNPLANWTAVEPATTPVSPKSVNPLLASAALPAAISETPTTNAEKKPASNDSVRPGRRAAIALLVLAASLALAFRLNRWQSDKDSVEGPVVLDTHWQEVVRFADISPAPLAEFPKLDRFDTAQAEAPKPVPAPSEAVSLRPAARWPTDRVVVRSKSEVTRATDIDPLASSKTRFAVIVRRSAPAESGQPNNRPAEVASLASVPLATEKPQVMVTMNSTKQMSDPPAFERSSASSLIASRTSLPKPSTRVDPLVASSVLVSSSGFDASRWLARRGTASRSVQPIQMVESQAVAGPIALPLSESPLSQSNVSMSRSEPPAVGQSSFAGVGGRPWLPPSKTVSTVSGVSADPSTLSTRQASLPTKSSAIFKIALLAEEVAPPLKETTTEAGNSSAVISPKRTEEQGSQVAASWMLPIIRAYDRTDLTMLRSLSRIDTAASTDTFTGFTTNHSLLNRRALPPPTIATITAESTAGPMPGSPAILLTSASMLVELLASPPLASWPRAESAGPIPIVSSESFNSLTRWLSRTALPTVLEDVGTSITPRSSVPMPILPRRERPLTPAELLEDPK